MNFLLPHRIPSPGNAEGDIGFSKLQIDSETDTTFTMTRILPPGAWSKNVIVIQKSFLTQTEQDGETFWTVNIDDVPTAVLSWE